MGRVSDMAMQMGKLPAFARRTDPPTSHAAAARKSMKPSSHGAKIRLALMDMPDGGTIYEIARKTQDMFGLAGMLDHVQVARMMAVLARPPRCYVKRAGLTRVALETGNECDVWVVV